MKDIIRIFTVLALGLFLVPACTDTEEEEEKQKQEQELRYFDLYMASTFKDTIDPPTESGLYYINFEEGSGASPGEEDWVWVNYVAYTIPGDMVVDTYVENVAEDNGLYSDAALYGPYKMFSGTVTDGFSEGLSLMKEGGKAIMCMTSDLAYGKLGANLMKSVSEYQSMKYEVELLEVIGTDIEGYEAAKMMAFANTIPGMDTIYDPTTESFMYYVVDEAMPDSAEVVVDTVVYVTYKGYLIDGRVFDDNLDGDLFSFTVGEAGSVISGWQLGLQRFREGEKGRLIIPYSLGYGETGNVSGGIVSIPPYETLVFDIEVVNLAATSGVDSEVK